ncbi:expressed unknown protein [Ectocarpus siliculosus]|uniref:Uncharacterized protein n=1 Tax=Ectocarpus siliculosus TaxID=2880 RepID=D7G0R7_ECTSI|nr:expressed unknown protein [Ectocarpus siliculosus]|eukprot:CBJ33092.1 expressed unknown protein [Ectocarpus siliculosus]
MIIAPVFFFHEFSWDNPSEAFTPDELASAATFEDRFFLEVFDAVGGGLICRSPEFSLEADDASNESDTSTLLLLLTPAALLLLCCCGVFFVACPYYDKIVRRRRRNDLRPSLIDVDDTYIIDGEGQPAILALDSHVIPLAHAHFWPIDVTGSLNASRNGPSYVLRRAGSGNGGGGSGGGGATTTNSGSWTRTVLAMGHSVTESIGRAAGLTIHSAGTSGSGGGGGGRGAGGVGGSGGSTGRNGGHVAGDHLALDDACSGVAAVAGRGASVAGSGEVVSSSSSWGGMRSGATWAFGGGGNAAAVAPADDSNSAPSASWYSRQSSLVDFAALLGRAENSSSNNNNNGGAPESGGGWMPGVGRNAIGAGVLGRVGGGGSGGSGGGSGSYDREKVVTVIVTGVEADQVEIVEVSRAVALDEAGVEIPAMTTAVVGLEIMEDFSDHESMDGRVATSPIHSPAAMA